jgi:hypothetical protein
MKILAAFLVTLALTSTRAMAAVEKMYYAGEAKLSSASGQSYGSQAFLLEKIHDPDNNLIVERAVVVKPDQSVDEFTMHLNVKGNSFSIKEKTVQGSGLLFGPAWHWTYFKGTYEAANGVRIEDENFMTDQEVLVARKKISDREGKTLTYMDITLKAITPQTFEILSTCLLKKRLPPAAQ